MNRFGVTHRRSLLVAVLLICSVTIQGSLAQSNRVAPLRSGEYVRDTVDLIEPTDRQRVIEICEASSDVATILVMTISASRIYDGGDIPFEAFSSALFETLQFRGAVAQNIDWSNGMFLLVSRGDRKVSIVLGSKWGNEQYVAASAIKENIILPSFRDENFSEGILAGVQALSDIAHGEALPQPSTFSFSALLVGFLKSLALGLSIFIILIALWAARRAWTRHFGAKAIFAAVQAGDEERVAKLLKSGVAADAADARSATPLYHACRAGNYEIVCDLLEHEAYPNAKTSRGDFPLFQAAQEGYSDVAGALLSAGAHTDEANDMGVTPLIVAAHRGHLDVVELMVEREVTIDAQNAHGLTALFAAVEKGHEDVIAYLLDCGADVNRSTDEGITPLMRSVLTAQKSGNHDIMQMLLAQGADVNACARAPENTTALMMAVQLSEIETVELLLNSGADIDMKYEGDVDSIGLASRKDDKQLVALLTKYKERGPVQRNIIDAARFGDVDRVKEILKESPRQVNTRTANSRWTPLHLAVLEGNRELVELLVSNGARLDTKNKDGETAYDVALARGYKEIAELIQNFEKSKLGILDAVRKNDRARVAEILLGEPRKVLVTSANKKWTPLHLAAMDGNQPMVEFLLARGADFHALNVDGKTARDVAAEKGHKELAALLKACEAERVATLGFFELVSSGDLDKVKGALIDSPGCVQMVTANRQWSALHMATQDGDEAMVELLLNHGADVNAGNKRGKTPLHHAAGKGDTRIVEILLAHGADLAVRYHGKTPLQRARALGQEEAVEMLTQSE